MILHHDRKLVFLAYPKTGTTSAVHVLKREGFQVTLNLSWPGYAYVHDPTRLDGFRHFTITRHPQYRFVSQFRDFILDRRMARRAWPPGKYTSSFADYLARVIDRDVDERPWLSITHDEFLGPGPVSFSRIEDGFRIPYVDDRPVPRLNASRFGPIRLGDFFTSQSVLRRFAEFFVRDFERFGYDLLNR